jgi:hypothetical protein
MLDGLEKTPLLADRQFLCRPSGLKEKPIRGWESIVGQDSFGDSLFTIGSTGMQDLLTTGLADPICKPIWTIARSAVTMIRGGNPPWGGDSIPASGGMGRTQVCK